MRFQYLRPVKMCIRDRHGADGEQGGQRAAKAVGVFQADGPADLEQAGEQQNDPGHGDLQC